MASLLPRIIVDMPTGIEGVTCVMVEAEMFMHRNHDAWSAALLCLVDRHVLVGLFCGRITPAGVEGVMDVVVGPETLVHQNYGARPARECYRGALGEVFQRERLSSSKPCHDVGEQKSEVA